VDPPRDDAVAPRDDADVPGHEVDASRDDVSTQRDDVDSPRDDVKTPCNDVDAPRNDVETPCNDADAPRTDVDPPRHDVNEAGDDVDAKCEGARAAPGVLRLARGARIDVNGRSFAMRQPDMKRLPALIARARREVGADQPSVAHAVRVSLRTFSRWETGKHYPGEEQSRDLAVALSNASGETWRALVDALRLPLDELLDECPEQRTAADGPHVRAQSSNEAAKTAKTAAIVAVERDEPPHVVPLTATVDLQSTVDDLIRAYAEEADMSPRRLRLVLGLLLGELHMMGVDVEDGRALVMHARRRLR
jgi:hypothetical protein